jgi:anthranilate synthase component 2
MHGKTSAIHHDGKGLFEGLPDPFEATRYHSLIVDEATLPACLEVTSRTTSGTLMGLRHREMPEHAPLEGVQFHPESFLTPQGRWLLAAFLRTPQLELAT